MKSYEQNIKIIEEKYSIQKHTWEMAGPFINLRNLAQESGDKDTASWAQYEIDALYLIPQSFIVVNEYKRRLPEHIDDFSLEQIEYYINRFKTTSNLQLKCCYGDILIDYGGSTTVKKFDIFKELVPSLISVAMEGLIDIENIRSVFIDSIGRAIELSLKFGDEQLLKTAVDALYTFYTQIGNLYDYRWCLETFDIIFEISKNHKMKTILDDYDMGQISFVLNEAMKHHSEDDNFFMYREVINRQIQWMTKYLSSTQVEKMQYSIKIGESFEKEADLHIQGEKKDYWSAGISTENAIQHYIEIGKTERLPELKVKLRQIHLKAEKQFSSYGTEVQMPEWIKERLKIYENLTSIEQLLKSILIDRSLILSVEGIKKETQRLIHEHPLMYLPRASIIGNGRKISNPTNDDEMFEFHFHQTYLREFDFRVVFLLCNIVFILEKKKICVDDVMKFYRKWEFYDPKRDTLIERGIQRFLEKDYISAMHIIIPQIEGLLRHMFYCVDLSTTTIQHGTTQHEELLHQFLQRTEVKEALGEDLHKCYEVVLVLGQGWNLRNEIAHGIAYQEIFNLKFASVIFYLFMRLLGFGTKKADADLVDSKTSTTQARSES